MDDTCLHCGTPWDQSKQHAKVCLIGAGSRQSELSEALRLRQAQQTKAHA